ncbi:Alpha/Beta hydrolase protein [Apodospora peruviana]|uniref:Carboxylic ester hydrolase n=1 Tax=Apodospora peruviana TaxID=516989 RepID=A0AAE0MF20_9PEZI|nr:Alpha/Beta hydrolase protein [Apodospora peruviana]
MMFVSFVLGALAVASLVSPVACVDPAVNLTSSLYIGQPLLSGITQWLGMRYAAPPVGELRFQPPSDPPFVASPQPATQHGKICLGTGDSPNSTLSSEDCLFLDVYAPSNATANSNLPVFVFIQGGGFSNNAEPNLNGTGLIMASDRSIIVVTFNYRVGPYGFLTDGGSDQIPANNGLRDQRKALEWVQNNIGQFGGDPGHVVLGGVSAGAASISLHMVAYGGRDESLFHAVAAESVSFPMLLKDYETKYQYENLAIRLGCAGETESDTIGCLRGKSAVEIQEQNFNIPYPGGANPPLYMWGPVIDHDMLNDFMYAAFEKGKFVRVRAAIFGDDTNGGSVFVPPGVSSLGQCSQFIKDQYPYVSLEQLWKLNQMYHSPDADQQGNCTSAVKTGCGGWRRQLSNLYGEMRYMCPSIFVIESLMRYKVDATYAYRWNVEDRDQMDDGLGVPHTSELSALFGPDNIPSGFGIEVPKSYFPDGTNAQAVAAIQGYWTSFIRSYDPNRFYHHKGGRGPANWHLLDYIGYPYQRMVFDTGGTTCMEEIDRGLSKRCEYLREVGIHQ